MAREGHYSAYAARFDCADGQSLAFDMSMPSALDTWDISTLRFGRHGGPTGKDELFRARLYQRIGAVTAAAGQVESAMKRLLLLLRKDSGGFSRADEAWSTLEKKLAREAAQPDPDARRKRLGRVLEWGEQNEAKRRRDDVIHSHWWEFDGIGAVRARFEHKHNGKVMRGTLEGLEDDAEILREYARRLDELLGEDWPRAMLPAEGTVGGRP